MHFDYIVNAEKRYVIALARSDGKIVKGIAKCSPVDNFDVETGKKIASARCKAKVMRKQALSAAKKVDEAREAFELAKKRLYEAEELSWNSFVKVDVAEKELESLSY